MSWFVEGKEDIAVALGACLCPGTPHGDGDTVYLRAELDYAGGLLVLSAMTGESEEPLIARLSKAYLLAGIASWSFLDGEGKPVPASHANISRLAWNGPAMTIANAAADLYGEAVLGPLGLTASESSPSGQSDDSTSPIPSSGD